MLGLAAHCSAALNVGQVLEWFDAIFGVMNLNQYSIAAAQPGLAVDRMLNPWRPVPDPDEQEIIAIHTGTRTAIIDVPDAVTRLPVASENLRAECSLREMTPYGTDAAAATWNR